MNAISQFANEHRVNFALLTSTSLRAMGSDEMIPSLRLISIVGEAIAYDVGDKWRSFAKLVNGRYRLYLSLIVRMNYTESFHRPRLRSRRMLLLF